MRNMRLRVLFVALFLATSATAQKAPPWTMQTTNSAASLRGIHAVGDGKVAWASGSEGTVLKTEDGGTTWAKCPTPKGADKLDFRGIWAWDATTAIVMSSGTGDASRLYKTIDGCKTWSLKYTNPDAKGFWDALVFATDRQGFLAGDPVDGAFRIFSTRDGGDAWFLEDDPGLTADAKTEGAFAASNTSLAASGGSFWLGSGGKAGAHVFYSYAKCEAGTDGACALAWEKVSVPMAGGSGGAGVFSVGPRNVMGRWLMVAVGGDYEKPAATAGTSAYSGDGGKTWTAAAVPPHGYRSAVAWDKAARCWIAAGTNGSDFSRDDGKTWLPLDDGTWNALSLPYVVGPKGRIARLADGAILAK